MEASAHSVCLTSHAAVALPGSDAPGVFTQTQAYALVAKRSCQECRLGHSRELLLRKDLKPVGENTVEHPAFPVAKFELIQGKLEPVVAFLSDREVAEDEKAALRVIRILEAVKR